MLLKKNMARSVRGFTLTEAAIVLGIVGLLLGAIWVAAAAVYNNMRISTTTTQILQMAQAIRAIHATSQTIDDGVTAQDGAVLMARAGAVPKDMLDDALNPNSVTSVWNSEVTIEAAADTQGNAGRAFRITYTGVPQSACSDLLVRNTGAGRDTGLVSAGANGAEVTRDNMPIGVTTAVQQCNVTTTAGNDVAFTFLLRT
ncbi:MAG: prepilin-type N-terminal cleavage/methylation domain-containing protein [Alphaproteobacteria bacterium]|nr:prepilin-type N-terminal cleavage/methylation domain-containing protein [Alphaproteobacteria bacterium]